MTEVKFCGLSRHREVDAAAELGATYVGFVVQAPESHRDISLDRANELIDEAPLDVRTVLVTPTDDGDDLRQAVETCRPDVVQVHGSPPAKAVEAVRGDLGVETWTSCSPGDDVDAALDRLEALASRHEAVVLDAVREGYGGHGETIDWSAARALADQLGAADEDGRNARADGGEGLRVVLAGGLDADNVAQAIERVEPWCVDVSSGIETDRRKDVDRMRAFARAVDAAGETLHEDEPGDETADETDRTEDQL